MEFQQSIQQRFEKIFDINFIFKISLRKIEIDNEKGIEIKREITDVKSVPIKNGSAPNLLFIGSQSLK